MLGPYHGCACTNIGPTPILCSHQCFACARTDGVPALGLRPHQHCARTNIVPAPICCPHQYVARTNMFPTPIWCLHQYVARTNMLPAPICCRTNMLPAPMCFPSGSTTARRNCGRSGSAAPRERSPPATHSSCCSCAPSISERSSGGSSEKNQLCRGRRCRLQPV